MQPSSNLKSFLAVLIILIVPAALLVAFFRNYSPEGGGHEHGDAAASGKSGDKSAKKPDHDMSAMKTGSDKSAVEPAGDKSAKKSDHDMSAMKTGSDKSAVEPVGDKSAVKPGHDMSAMKPGGDMSAMKPSSGMNEMARTSAMPGVPGVSRLYHIGATEFFLNHPEHITLTTKQQAALNRLKQKALLSKSTVQRKIEEAEQELWELTGADEPDIAQIQVKVQAIEKLRGEQRLAFIQSVGEAATVLTDEQRQMLLGTGVSK
jgi:Spy/CpxP family protein refolding chaperone